MANAVVEKGYFVQCFLQQQVSASSRRRESEELLDYCVNSTEQSVHCCSSPVNVPDVNNAPCQLIFLSREEPKWPYDKSSNPARTKVKMLLFLTNQSKLEKRRVFTSLLYVLFGVVGRHLSWQRRIRWLRPQNGSKSLQSFSKAERLNILFLP